MCRFNSGVSTYFCDEPCVADMHAIVLLQTGDTQTIQILLESRVSFCPSTFLYMSHFGYRPDIKFFCDLDYDPFLIMQDQGKVYGTFLFPFTLDWTFSPGIGFTISLFEYEATIPTLWNAVRGAFTTTRGP
jgi:hypothetical protein